MKTCFPLARCAALLALAALLPALLPAHPVAAAEAPATLLVTCLCDETGREEFGGLLVAHGITLLVEEELFRTGRFAPLEQNVEILGQMNRLVEAAWRPADQTARAVYLEQARGMGADAVVYGVVRDFGVSRGRSFAGPFSSSRTTVRVAVELTLEQRGLPPRTCRGEGKAGTRSVGAFFRVREGRIVFDDTTVGLAAKRAVALAVEELVKDE